MKHFQLTTLSLSLLGLFGTNAYADAVPHVELDEIVITAEKQVKQSLGASTITTQDLERTPVASDISEIVRKMPGVNLTGNSATGQRGNNRQIDIRGMGPENTLILVDGKPITSRSSVRYGWRGERDTRGDSQWIPAGAIESIEVLRGPSASRYGNGAMGGVVNIVTKKVTDEFHGNVELYANKPEDSKEGDSHRVSATLSGPIIANKLGFRVYGNFNKTDMDDPTINPLVKYYNANGTSYWARAAGREGVENKDAGLRLSYNINDHHHLNFDATYGRQGNEYAGDTQYSNRDASNATTSTQSTSNLLLQSLLGSETNIMRRDGYALSYDGKYSFGDVNLTAQYDQTKNTRLNEGLAGGPEGVIQTNPYFENTKLKTYRLHGEADIPLTWGVPQTLTVGAEYVHDKFVDNANMDEGTATGTVASDLFASAYVTGDRTTMKSEIASVYAEDNLQLGNKTNLVLALRYDHHNKSGSNLSPSLNLTHHLTDAWTLKAGIAKAYKTPNLYQNSEGYLLYTRGQGCPIYLGSGQRCILQGNSELNPETSINTEFGVQYNHGNINASATYFYNDYKDKIEAGTTVLNTQTVGGATYRLLKWENIPKAVVEGLEGSVAWRHGDLSWTNNITYMRKSEDKSTGNPLSLVPNYTFNSIVGYNINDKWDVNAIYTQYGRQRVRHNKQSIIEQAQPDTPDVKSYGVVSVNTGYRFGNNIKARVGINNLFDEQKLRDVSVGQSYNETGRTYYISLGYDF